MGPVELVIPVLGVLLTTDPVALPIQARAVPATRVPGAENIPDPAALHTMVRAVQDTPAPVVPPTMARVVPPTMGLGVLVMRVLADPAIQVLAGTGASAQTFVGNFTLAAFGVVRGKSKRGQDLVTGVT